MNSLSYLIISKITHKVSRTVYEIDVFYIFWIDGGKCGQPLFFYQSNNSNLQKGTIFTTAIVTLSELPRQNEK